MDKLEHYLDQVCRSIGGPKSLRQHVRQELREHLLDAVAEHKAAGLSEEKALERALEDFGGPEQVRSEMEETHGHRLLPVVIDKAMQWKEKTMRAKWLWTTWAHIAVVILLLLELASIVFAKTYFVPKMKKILREEWLDLDMFRDNLLLTWIPTFLDGLDHVVDMAVWIALALAAVWGLFEWRVRSDNKSFMRLSALGTAGLGLTVVLVLFAWALVVPFLVGVPGMEARIPEEKIKAKKERVDTSIKAIEQALTKNDWDSIQENSNEASQQMATLAQWGAAAPTLVSMHEQAKLDETRTQLKAAKNAMWKVQLASLAKDAAGLEDALKSFHEAYDKLQAASKPVK